MQAKLIYPQLLIINPGISVHLRRLYDYIAVNLATSAIRELLQTVLCIDFRIIIIHV